MCGGEAGAADTEFMKEPGKHFAEGEGMFLNSVGFACSFQQQCMFAFLVICSSCEYVVNSFDAVFIVAPYILKTILFLPPRSSGKQTAGMENPWSFRGCWSMNSYQLLRSIIGHAGYN